MTANPSDEPPTAQVEAECLELGRAVVSALAGVLDGLPNASRKPQEVARRLKINKDLSSRTLTALRSSEPWAAIHSLPGTVPLRQLVDAAAAQGSPATETEHALTLIDRFDAFVRREFGSRAELQSLLSTRVAGAREQLLASSKQAVFRGMAGLRGLTVDILAVTFVVHPTDADSDRCDVLAIIGSHGVRRTRPNSRYTFRFGCDNRDDRASIDDVLLADFCSPHPIPVDLRIDGRFLVGELKENVFGRQSTANLVSYEDLPSQHSRTVQPGSPPWFSAGVLHPTRQLQFDLLLHRDIWPSRTPELGLFHRGADEFDSSKPIAETSTIACDDSIVELDSPHFGGHAVSGYARMLDSVCDARGWTLADLRGYRCESSYPVYGSSYVMVMAGA